jgi:hypothetical protein
VIKKLPDNQAEKHRQQVNDRPGQHVESEQPGPVKQYLPDIF